MLRDETRDAILAGPLPWRFVEFDRGDEKAYGRWVREMWADRAGLLICEQDIVPTHDQLLDIGTCGHDWCCYPYDDDLYPVGPMFGLARFSARLMRTHPHAAERALVGGYWGDEEAVWWNVDARVARDLLIRLGQGSYCMHDTAVRHLHVGAPSGPA